MAGDRDVILSRRAKFVTAALAAAGMTLVVRKDPTEAVPVAQAQPVPPRPQVCLSPMPHDFLAEARHALAEKNYAEAVRLFRNVYDLAHKPQVQQELAEACSGAQDFLCARGIYDGLLEASRADGGAPLPNAAQLEALRAQADAKLGTIVVTSNDPNIHAKLDGKAVADASAPLRVNPGRHVVSVVGSLGDEQTREVVVPVGGQVEVSFGLPGYDAGPQVCLENIWVEQQPPPPPPSRPPSGCGCTIPGDPT
jgi:hypothetical protein